MNVEIDKDIVDKVINASVGGGVPSSYTVHCTAERVMLVFGFIPGSDRVALESMVEKQTQGKWVNDSEIADLVGVKMAIGHPAQHEILKNRLDNALAGHQKQ